MKIAINYILIGLFCATIDWSIFVLLVHKSHLSISIANFISSHIGIFSSFIINAIFNFRVGNMLVKRFIFFYFTALIGYIFGHYFVIYFVNNLNFSADISKALSFLGIFLIQFTINKLITFKPL